MIWILNTRRLPGSCDYHTAVNRYLYSISPIKILSDRKVSYSQCGKEAVIHDMMKTSIPLIL